MKKIKCSICQKEKSISNFYSSNNEKFKIIGTIPYCKDCCKEKILNKNGTVNKKEFINLLKDLDKPFIITLFNDVKNDDINKIIGNYIKKLNINKEYKDWTYKDSIRKIQDICTKDKIINGKEILNNNTENNINKDKTSSQNVNNNIEKKDISKKQLLTESRKSKQDCINFLGYDPFENELEEDKPILYNSLIAYLDNSTQEDSYKQPVVVQIVKTFNQINRVDQGMTEALSNIDNIIDNEKAIKSLSATKKTLLASISTLAKDNGISVNYNNNKSKGGNTLNGILKQFDEIGLESAQLNLFNIETCKSMKQIADISNKSILDQLMLDENDSKQIITQQRELIRELQNKLDKEIEENRLLKMKIKRMRNN